VSNTLFKQNSKMDGMSGVFGRECEDRTAYRVWF